MSYEIFKYSESFNISRDFFPSLIKTSIIGEPSGLSLPCPSQACPWKFCPGIVLDKNFPLPTSPKNLNPRNFLSQTKLEDKARTIIFLSEKWPQNAKNFQGQVWDGQNKDKI